MTVVSSRVFNLVATTALSRHQRLPRYDPSDFSDSIVTCSNWHHWLGWMKKGEVPRLSDLDLWVDGKGGPPLRSIQFSRIEGEGVLFLLYSVQSKRRRGGSPPPLLGPTGGTWPSSTRAHLHSPRIKPDSSSRQTDYGWVGLFCGVGTGFS